MKTYQELTFTTETGADVKTSAYEGVSVQHIIGAHWDPVKGEEVQSATFSMQLTSEDARELAANLLKAADFADEAEKSRPQKRRY